MKITYIHHSSFLVETEENYFLFDYFEGKLPQLKEDKPLLVFASHRHGDHFSPVIFDLVKTHASTGFVLSDDIWKRRVPEELMGKNGKFELNHAGLLVYSHGEYLNLGRTIGTFGYSVKKKKPGKKKTKK